MAAQILDVARVLDEGRWTRYQQWLVFLTALTIVFDGIDNQLLGVAIPSLLAEWHVPRAAFAPVVALGYCGMMIGGAAAGIAGDRIGRRAALVGSMALFSIATLTFAAVDSVKALAFLRFVAGIGLGGAMPNATALAAEYVPSRRRPFAVTLTIVCVPLGATLAGLIAIRAIPAIGWRGLFVVGGAVPLVVAVALARVLPESPRYLARDRRRWPELVAFLRRMGHPIDLDAMFAEPVAGERTGARIRDILTPEYVRDTLALCAAFFSCLLAVYLGFAWLPSIITGAGLSGTVASSAISAFNLGGVAGAIAGGALLGRIGSRPTMVTMASGAVAGALILSRMPITSHSAVPPLLALLAVTGGLINAVQTTMFALAAHVYPTRIRATGVGFAVSIGRSGAIISGYAGPWALDYGGSPAYFALMAATLTVTVVALALVRRHIPRAGHRFGST